MKTRAILAVGVEALAVAALGTIVALVANAVSPRGLRLDREYFRRVGHVSAGATGSATRGANPAAVAPAAADPAAVVVRRLEQRRLRVAASRDVQAWFRDPQYEQGIVVFVDARADPPFQAGHIPGAWQFNHYRPEQHLATVLPACLGALKVVVYCSGGECEDSEFAALMLRDAGVPPDSIFVYPGGMADWISHRLPVETGARRSGRLLPPTP